MQECLDLNTTEEYTLNLLKTKGVEEISPSKLYKKNMSRYKSKENAQNILECLASKGYGRMVKLNNGGYNFKFYYS